ncbi:PREDICTED: Fc receptor-like protein 3 [Propithecus coquereli]|uniref:Fc receptor-like protein 3 n=1 Tax=Propithecus coquereli TaxID=379532 RepID=UPI00063EFC37|nr:PREDICTED: Fc receptor-like protein 3 [Propithecus coquereli]
MEGSHMTLTCEIRETQFPQQKSVVQLQFCFFRDSQVLGSGWSSSPELQITAMRSEDSGSYWCEAKTVIHNVIKMSQRSWIHVQRVPVSGVNLEIQPSGGQLIEGENLVLICSVAKGTGTITFSWHKDGRRSVGRKTQRSLVAKLQVGSVNESVAGRYYCAADNSHGPVHSKWSTVTVKIPASRPVLTLRMLRAQAVEGDVVELHCESQRGSPPISYLFYHKDVSMGSSSAPSGGGVSFNLSLTVEHSGNYFCEADNGLGHQRSQRVSLNVTVPASRPVLTLRGARAQAVVGDVVELHCEALRGSPPILYWFYHEDVTLGNSSAPSGGGVSFNLSLTAEHSGNYFCEADNGLGAQRSEVVMLSVTGTSRNRAGLITAGAIGGLLCILGLAAPAALLCHCRTQRKSGGLSTTGTSSYSPSECQMPSSSSPSGRDPQEPAHHEPLDLLELQPVYSSVNPVYSTIVYSQIWSLPHTTENSANSPRMHREDKELAVFYSELKKAPQDESTGQAHEDDTENYENVLCVPLALDH